MIGGTLVISCVTRKILARNDRFSTDRIRDAGNGVSVLLVGNEHVSSRSTMNQIAAVIQVALVAGVNPASLPNLSWPPDVLISTWTPILAIQHKQQERRIPVLLLGETPRDRLWERLPCPALSRSVPARLTCRAALTLHTGPSFGHMPCYAKGPLPAGKGP